MQIWQAKVYERDSDEATLYHFQHKSDLEKTIKATWSKGSVDEHGHKIIFTETDTGHPLVYANDGRVIIETCPIDFELLTQSTHF